MKTKKKIIIGNWKMNVFSDKDAKKLMVGVVKASVKLSRVDVVVCPPFVFAAALASFGTKKVALGVQNIAEEEKGSLTGEVSAFHAKAYKVRYAIVGHSERRARGETDGMVSKKIMCALNAGVTPVVCVGESLRDEHGEYLSFMKTQLATSLAKVNKTQIGDLVIAYEPVWAIGAKEAMNVNQIHEMVLYIQKCLRDMYGTSVPFPPILYGGAVSEDNARTIVEGSYVDGLLVGRASLDAKSFGTLISSVNEIR